MGGFELMAWLQTHPNFKKISVIVLSGSTDPADRERSAALGAKAFYGKPYESAHLQFLVQTVWEERFRKNP